MEKQHTENEYISRINKILDYIEANLEKPFTLEELAGVANFSKFHFNRIFKAMIGETPFQFITRVRIEKAAYIISTGKSNNIAEIASKCGYADITTFSKNFKRHFNVSASLYRQMQFKNSNLSQLVSNTQQREEKLHVYFCPDSQTIKWRTIMKLNKSVEVKYLPKMTVAYIRYTGSYKGNEKLFRNLWNKLFKWAEPRNLVGGKDFKALVVYHDDPSITDEEKLRMSVCFTVPSDTKVEGEVGKMEIEAGKYVIARFELSVKDFQQAWDWVYGEWFPASGYQPDDKACFEMYTEEPQNGIIKLDICVPVKPI
ncbi:MAG: GyrI-like domain-containing protein [Paludibacter sp.]|nr:GyrI-like domain-containing protein [Paludibacter sp.]MDD4198913.1 GyrI-like domain-containing protein [Paludibacter sp.]MDD4428466.1 GyrI-like domain-containing protein [Paludibacter sp.]